MLENINIKESPIANKIAARVDAGVVKIKKIIRFKVKSALAEKKM